MALILPTATYRDSFGSNTLVTMTFAGTADDGDTFSSGLGTNLVAHWGQTTDNPTQTSEGVDITYAPTTGIFTFNLPEDDMAFTLFILAKI